MVEHNLAKVGVAGSTPVSRSIFLHIFLLLFLFSRTFAQTPYLKPRYQVSGSCITPALLGLDRSKRCLIPLDPEKERISLPAYRLIGQLKKAGYPALKARSGTILFERAPLRRFPKVEAAIRSEYLKRYPALKIVKIDISPTGSLKRKRIATQRCDLRLFEGNFKKNRGSAILICQDRHYYLRYELFASLPVYKALHQIKKDRIITSNQVKREEIAFERFGDMPLAQLGPGSVARRNIRAGEIIGRNMVMPMPAVRKHGRVHAIFREGGVTVEFDATALQNGRIGDMVTIRRDDGKTLRALVMGKEKVEIR